MAVTPADWLDSINASLKANRQKELRAKWEPDCPRFYPQQFLLHRDSVKHPGLVVIGEEFSIASPCSCDAQGPS
jgi:hypothetical protein